jgi:hypothetical protein
MATTKKALVMAEELVSELRQRQTALAVALTYDTDGSPLVRLGALVLRLRPAPLLPVLSSRSCRLVGLWRRTSLVWMLRCSIRMSSK